VRETPGRKLREICTSRGECVFDNGYDANIKKLNKHNPKTLACYEKCGND
jgi:hypothetical protein